MHASYQRGPKGARDHALVAREKVSIEMAKLQKTLKRLNNNLKDIQTKAVGMEKEFVD